MEVTFEQASNNTVDVEFVVRLPSLPLPPSEHRFTLHPDTPWRLSETNPISQLHGLSTPPGCKMADPHWTRLAAAAGSPRMRRAVAAARRMRTGAKGAALGWV